MIRWNFKLKLLSVLSFSGVWAANGGEARGDRLWVQQAASDMHRQPVSTLAFVLPKKMRR